MQTKRPILATLQYKKMQASNKTFIHGLEHTTNVQHQRLISVKIQCNGQTMNRQCTVVKQSSYKTEINQRAREKYVALMKKLKKSLISQKLWPGQCKIRLKYFFNIYNVLINTLHGKVLKYVLTFIYDFPQRSREDICKELLF